MIPLTGSISSNSSEQEVERGFPKAWGVVRVGARLYLMVTVISLLQGECILGDQPPTKANTLNMTELDLPNRYILALYFQSYNYRKKKKFFHLSLADFAVSPTPPSQTIITKEKENLLQRSYTGRGSRLPRQSESKPMLLSVPSKSSNHKGGKASSHEITRKSTKHCFKSDFK